MTFAQDVTENQCSTASSASDQTVTEGGLHAVHWDDFITDATTLTNLKETGRGLIEINLGYLPPNDVMLPYEPYLRALIQSYWQSMIPDDDFFQQVEDHIKLIRNADMKHNVSLVYDEAIYKITGRRFRPMAMPPKTGSLDFWGMSHSLNIR